MQGTNGGGREEGRVLRGEERERGNKGRRQGGMERMKEVEMKGGRKEGREQKTEGKLRDGK